jgi:hypothetical protein
LILWQGSANMKKNWWNESERRGLKLHESNGWKFCMANGSKPKIPTGLQSKFQQGQKKPVTEKTLEPNWLTKSKCR